MSQYCQCGAIQGSDTCRAMHDFTKPPKPEITKARVVARLRGSAEMYRKQAEFERHNIMNPHPRREVKAILRIAEALEAEAKVFEDVFR